VLIEAIQGEGGVIPAPDGYLRGIRQLCDDIGALMIVDEIQTGFGRTGEWFGFQHSNVRPDVVTLAKAMGNGMPVGACWATLDVAGVFEPGDHGSTYSGTALAAAAVTAVVDEMRRIDAPRVARERGAQLADLLAELPQVDAVRGSGLLLGAQLADGIEAPAVYRTLLERGLICNAVNASTLRFAPPITVADGEIVEAVTLVGDALAEVAP
jgi:acetylornithine/succinyldiaminopimelate/putrescine aminotransferase